MAPGVVSDVSWLFNTGNGFYQVNVTVDLLNAYRVVYAFEPMTSSIADRDEQLGYIEVLEDQTVAEGDTIGSLLQAGAYAHVHFGFLDQYSQICPEPFLSGPVRTELRDLIQRDYPQYEICN